MSGELNEFHELEMIENAWLNHHATEQPRDATADIRFLLGVVKRMRASHRTFEATTLKASAEQEQRTKDFARVALKNGNALLMAEARIRFLEGQLDEMLHWAAAQAATTNNAVRSILNDYIEDDLKHATNPS